MGLWDRLTGSYEKTRRKNERETAKAQLRDRKEQERIIHTQLEERQDLQKQIVTLRKKHTQERFGLYRSMSKHYGSIGKQDELRKLLKEERRERSPRPDSGHDFEPS